MRWAPTLLRSRFRARATGVFHSSAVIGRDARITNLTGDDASLTVGKHSRIDGEIIVYPGARVVVGDYCYIGVGTRVWAYASIQFDDYVIVAHGVSIMDSTTHPIDFAERKSQIEEQLGGGAPGRYDLKPAPVVFGRGAWVCAAAVVLKGVTVGAEAIIAAGSVVRRDVEAYSTYRT